MTHRAWAALVDDPFGAQDDACPVVAAKPTDTAEEAIEAWNTRVNDMTDEQRSHLTRLAEEMVDALALSGGGYLNEYGD